MISALRSRMGLHVSTCGKAMLFRPVPNKSKEAVPPIPAAQPPTYVQARVEVQVASH